MKIIQLNNLYRPYNKGGAERIVEIIDNEFKEAGHLVKIISTRPIHLKSEHEISGNYYLPSLYSDLNKRSALFKSGWHIANLFNYKKYKQIINILREEKPDLIISHNLLGLGLLTPLAIFKSGAKHIHILHDIQLLHPSGLMYFGKEDILGSLAAKSYQAITKFLFSFSKEKTIISPSQWLLKLHKAHNLFKDDKSFVINNPVAASGELHPEKQKAFCFVGQLEKHKGIDLFIEAAKAFPDYKFIIIGDGSLLENIKQNKTDNLEILGRQDSQKVSELISRSLAVIVPSRCYENSPTVIYEAYAVNTPAIAADLGGIPELIQRFGGLLFEPDNSQSLIEMIALFLASPPLLKKSETPLTYSKAILEKIS